MTDHLHKYLNTLIPKSMLAYQFIEYVLKRCLLNQHAIIYISIKGVLPYTIPTKSIENAAMGRLIEYFKQYNDDDEIIKILKKVKKNRDNLAHRGFILDIEEQENDEYLEELNHQAKEHLGEAEKCLDLMLSEWGRLEKLGEKISKELKHDKAVDNPRA
jgi:hypothetical protein